MNSNNITLITKLKDTIFGQSVYRTKRGFHRIINQMKELKDPTIRNRVSRIKNQKNTYNGKRCFIMGNGPSLNKMDLAFFKDEYVWGTNRCYLLFNQIDWRPNFYVAVDKRVVPDNAAEINELIENNNNIRFYLPREFRTSRIINSNENLFWLEEKILSHANLPDSMFSLDPSKYIRTVRTVTITAIQLAIYFGFNPIYLIGCDTSYKVPSSVILENENSDLLISTAQDFNHFDQSYFGPGKKWHEPHVDRMIEQYEQTKVIADRVGVSIIDATVDGKLTVFPKINYLDLFPKR